MLKQLQEMIVQYVDVEKNAVTDEARFIEDLGFTSYDFMTLVGELEEEFDIQVDESQITDVRTVGDAIAYITKARAN